MARRETATRRGPSDGSDLPEHPFLRWQSLVRELQQDIQNNFLTVIRRALVSSTEIAAKTFAAWHTSRLPTCRDFVETEMRRSGTRLIDVRRFVHFLFWRLDSAERRSSNHLRLQIIAVVEKLDDLAKSDWTISDSISISDIMTKIESLGGITKIYDQWREREARAKTAKLHQRHEDAARRLGTSVQEVVALERREQQQHQERRDRRIEERFIAMIPEITEDVEWLQNETFMLVAVIATARGGRRMYKLRTPYRRRMINAVVNPTTPIR